MHRSAAVSCVLSSTAELTAAPILQGTQARRQVCIQSARPILSCDELTARKSACDEWYLSVSRAPRTRCLASRASHCTQQEHSVTVSHTECRGCNAVFAPKWAKEGSCHHLRFPGAACLQVAEDRRCLVDFEL